MRILGLGDNTVDTYMDRGEQYPGGNAVNVAVMARRLGAEAAYCGCFGNDEAGDMLRAALAAENIDTRHCRSCAMPNARAFIAHNHGDRRFIRSEPGCRAQWGEFSDADEIYIRAFDLVHSSIFSGLEPCRDQLRAVVRRWSFDFSEKWTRENLAAWLPSLDFAFLSSPDATDEDTQKLARHCASYGPECVIITRGARPALAWQGGQGTWQAPEPADIVDTLGAGDGLIAAFLLAMLDNKSPREALASGMRNAAEICGRFGAFGYGRAWGNNATMAKE